MPDLAQPQHGRCMGTAQHPLYCDLCWGRAGGDLRLFLLLHAVVYQKRCSTRCIKRDLEGSCSFLLAHGLADVSVSPAFYPLILDIYILNLYHVGWCSMCNEGAWHLCCRVLLLFWLLSGVARHSACLLSQ